MSAIQEKHYDIIIVGAGMVGATLALALSQQGMQILLLDHLKAPAPYHKEQMPDLRVSALNLASVNILKNLNVWKTISKMRVCAFEKMEIWEDLRQDISMINTLPFINKTGEHRNKTIFNCHDIQQPALGYIVENRIFQYCLHQAIAAMDNVDLYTETAITSFLSSPHEYDKTLLLSNKKKCSAKLIVGTDGANSRIREWAGFSLNKREYGQHALVSTVEINEGPLDVTWQAFTENGPMSLLPLPDCNHKHYASLVWYHHPDKVKWLMGLSDSDFTEELIQHFPDRLPGIINLHQRGYFPLAARHVQQYAAQGIALAGDAAHTINPLAGQGVNLGLMDVASLVDVIKKARDEKMDYASSDTLKFYQNQRKSANRNMLWLMDMFYYGFSNDIMPLKIVRNAALTLTNKFTPLVKYMEKYGSGLRGKLPALAQAQNNPLK